MQPMRYWTCVACLIAAAQVLAQPVLDDAVRSQLMRVFVEADAFSAVGGPLPHFEAFETPDGFAGYAVWTTEVVPNERGYDGPIKILVGVNAKGILTGIHVSQHHEPYGHFSIDTSDFAAQFQGKSVRDPFRLGEDVFAVSRATITVSSATRAIRDSARRVARQFLVP
jgi:NosR/NirI family transcriptional regulator, nitrous oxide reductase regulator